MRFQGKLTEWDDPRGFGFITPLDGGERVFVHISAFPNGSRRPGVGEFLNYDLGSDERGRPRAHKVAYIVGRTARPAVGRASSPAGIVAATAAAIALGTTVVSALAGTLPTWVLGVYPAASIATYVAYARDKSAARRGEWRTRESSLLLLGLVGGWPGALVAQHALRHKNRKASFQLQYWITVALNVAVLVWLRK